MCDCFTIGGPWIAEDPDCPIHGYEAQRLEKIDAEEKREEQETRIQDLEARVASLEYKLGRLTTSLL